MHLLTAIDSVRRFAYILDDFQHIVAVAVDEAASARVVVVFDGAVKPVADLDAEIVLICEGAELVRVFALLINGNHLVCEPHDILCFHAVIEILQKQNLTYPEEQKGENDKFHEPKPDVQAHGISLYEFLMLQIYIPFLSA